MQTAILNRILTFIALMLCWSFSHAAIIDIDARINNSRNPITVLFDAGTHFIDPIGVADGGAFNAASFGAGTGGRVGSWLWRYSYFTAELGQIDVNFTPFQISEAVAFSTAVSTSFTLSSAANVSFFIGDGLRGFEFSADNIGGVSLSTSSVPSPTTFWLLVIGVVGLFRSFGKQPKCPEFEQDH